MTMAAALASDWLKPVFCVLWSGITQGPINAPDPAVHTSMPVNALAILFGSR